MGLLSTDFISLRLGMAVPLAGGVGTCGLAMKAAQHPSLDADALKVTLAGLVYARVLVMHDESRQELFDQVGRAAEELVSGAPSMRFDSYTLTVDGCSFHIWPWEFADLETLKKPRFYTATLRGSKRGDDFWLHLGMPIGLERVLVPSVALIVLHTLSSSVTAQRRALLGQLLAAINRHFETPERAVGIGADLRAFKSALSSVTDLTRDDPRHGTQDDLAPIDASGPARGAGTYPLLVTSNAHADPDELLGDLASRPDSWPGIPIEELKALVLRQCVRYGSTHPAARVPGEAMRNFHVALQDNTPDEEELIHGAARAREGRIYFSAPEDAALPNELDISIPDLKRLIRVAADRLSARDRIGIVVRIQDAAAEGRVTVNALLPLVYCDPVPGVIGTASLALAQEIPLKDDDPMTGPKVLRAMAESRRISQTTRLGILQGLLHLGDRRAQPFVRGCWRLLDGSGKSKLALSGSSWEQASVSLIDFYLDWLEDAEEADFGTVAGRLAAVPDTYTSVIDVERVLPSAAAAGGPVLKILRTWTLAEYSRVIAPRLVCLLDRENEPNVMPAVLRMWGLDEHLDEQESIQATILTGKPKQDLE